MTQAAKAQPIMINNPAKMIINRFDPSNKKDFWFANELHEKIWKGRKQKNYRFKNRILNYIKTKINLFNLTK